MNTLFVISLIIVIIVIYKFIIKEPEKKMTDELTGISAVAFYIVFIVVVGAIIRFLFK